MSLEQDKSFSFGIPAQALNDGSTYYINVGVNPRIRNYSPMIVLSTRSFNAIKD